MAILLILVGHKNNFDFYGDKIKNNFDFFKGDKTPQAWVKGKGSSEGENNDLFWTVLGES